jgi:alkanesulfonate monooxygenase SsuD/methylene tetrahydromethanopterin reductase-like flavin-dependent oxidoreductase (luciferase family)
VAINNDRAEAINDARATVAFYAGIAQYEDFFAAHGFHEQALRLQEGVKRGDYLSVANLVPDEMAQTFVVCGTADEVRKRIEPAWDVVDSLTLAPPVYGLPPEKVFAYAGAIAATFYG